MGNTKIIVTQCTEGEGHHAVAIEAQRRRLIASEELRKKVLDVRFCGKVGE